MAELKSDPFGRIWLDPVLRPDLEFLPCQNINSDEAGQRALRRWQAAVCKFKQLGYEYVGNLGQWARNGARGDRFLPFGDRLESVSFKRIRWLQQEGENWDLKVEGLESSLVLKDHANVFMKAGDAGDSGGE